MRRSALAIGELLESAAQRRLERVVDERLHRRLLIGIDHEIAERRAAVLADRDVEAHRVAHRLEQLLDAPLRHLQVPRDLVRRRRAAELRRHLAHHTHHAVKALERVDRHADRAALLLRRAVHRPPDPPARVRPRRKPLW
jgi:hypothetical protein